MSNHSLKQDLPVVKTPEQECRERHPACQLWVLLSPCKLCIGKIWENRRQIKQVEAWASTSLVCHLCGSGAVRIEVGCPFILLPLGFRVLLNTLEVSHISSFAILKSPHLKNPLGKQVSFSAHIPLEALESLTGLVSLCKFLPPPG